MRNNQSEFNFDSSKETISGVELFFAVHVAGHAALLCASVLTCSVRAGSIGSFHAVFDAVARRAVAAQRMDVCGVWHFDRIELREPVLHRTAPTNATVQPGRFNRLRGGRQPQQNRALGLSEYLCGGILRCVRVGTYLDEAGQRMTANAGANGIVEKAIALTECNEDILPVTQSRVP
jgi:hypothetical protein